MHKKAIVSSIILLLSVGCAKIGSFQDPRLDETFSGNLAIIPKDKANPPHFYTHIVSIAGDGQKGEQVTVYGIMGPMGVANLDSKNGGGSISGLVGVAEGKSTLNITGFASADSNAIAREASVSGRIFINRSGNEIHTSKEDPIIIRALDKDGVVRDKIRIQFKGGINTVF